MKPLFLHHPLFRLLYPAFFGLLVYLLVLLLFGSLGQLAENYFSGEALLCIGLTYLLSESLRLCVLLFDRWRFVRSRLHLRVLLQTVAGLICSVAVVTAGVWSYFTWYVGFSEFSLELIVLNIVFAGCSLLYNLVHYSLLLLNRHNLERLRQEEALRQKTARQLAQLRSDVNPDLLFSSLEGLLPLLHTQPDAAEEYLDHLCAIYRYTLETRQQELAPAERELQALHSLVHLRRQQHGSSFVFQLRNDLPPGSGAFIPTGTLLRLLDTILDETILHPLQPLQLCCSVSGKAVALQYRQNRRLQPSASLQALLNDLTGSYACYSTRQVAFQEQGHQVTLHIPVLYLQPEEAPILHHT